MLRTLLAVFSLLGLASGCTPRAPAAEGAPAPALAIAPAPAAAAAGAAAPQVFGQPPTESLAATPLGAIAADPQRFAGQVVKTEGEIAQVCQRMGCWMELRAENVAPIRVPMAGHAFFLPRDVAGRRATVEGEVSVRALSAGERAHLESEGATATAQAIQIAATGVAIR